MNYPYIKDPKIAQTWGETKRKLDSRQLGGGNKKFIWEWSLEECLEAEKKYNEWLEKPRDEEEKRIKIHLYNTYLKPRIEELTNEQN